MKTMKAIVYDIILIVIYEGQLVGIDVGIPVQFDVEHHELPVAPDTAREMVLKVLLKDKVLNTVDFACSAIELIDNSEVVQ